MTHGHLLRYKVQLSIAPFTLLGVSLALFLGFRNNASYDRFWEGRRLWGSALNVSRSLARQAIAFTQFERKSEEIVYFINLLIAFVHSLRRQLRGTDARSDLERLLPPDVYQ
jgi:ion channel-forming bestrophin family protein